MRLKENRKDTLTSFPVFWMRVFSRDPSYAWLLPFFATFSFVFCSILQRKEEKKCPSLGVVDGFVNTSSAIQLVDVDSFQGTIGTVGFA